MNPIRRTRTALSTALTGLGLVACLAGPAASQIKEGDIVLSSNGVSSAQGVFYFDPANGMIKTLYSGQSCNAINMSWGNDTGRVLGGTRVFYVDKNGQWTQNVNYVTGSVSGIAPDQDGTFVITNQSTGHVYRLFGITSSTLTSVVKPNAICRDQSTGDFVIGSSAGHLLRMNRDTNKVTTFATGLGTITGVAYLPSANGRFAVSRQHPLTGLLFVDQNGTTVGSANLPDVDSVTFDERRNRVFAGGSYGSAGKVWELTPQGSVVRTLSFGTSYWFSGVDAWGDRRVSVSTTGTQGARAGAYLSFTESPNRTYCAALSLGTDSALQVAGQYQHIRLDNLFFLTVCGGVPLWTTGFSGTLTAGGVGWARFVLPYVPGLQLYITASALNPAKPGGLDLGNVEVVKVQ